MGYWPIEKMKITNRQSPDYAKIDTHGSYLVEAAGGRFLIPYYYLDNNAVPYMVDCISDGPYGSHEKTRSLLDEAMILYNTKQLDMRFDDFLLKLYADL